MMLQKVADFCHGTIRNIGISRYDGLRGEAEPRQPFTTGSQSGHQQYTPLLVACFFDEACLVLRVPACQCRPHLRLVSKYFAMEVWSPG